MALSAGSPAIDAGISLPGITTDQRGVPRPYGPAPDISAYEWTGVTSTNFSLGILTRSGGGWLISGDVPPGSVFRVQASSNLVTWWTISTNNSPSGTFSVQDNSAPGAHTRFYRTVSP